MSYKERAFDNPLNWSFTAGRVFGIRIRIHVVFVLCAVVLLAMEARHAPESAGFGRILVDALGVYALLFGVVLLHEFGHCFGCRRVGGEADEILLWPLGGLAYVSPPHDPAAHMITTVAGPAVNVVICAVCSAVLTLWFGTLGAVPWNPLHPMLPVDLNVLLTASTAQTWIMRLFGVSYFILLINLLPIFPFDGGRVLQAYLWPRKGYAPSMALATTTGMIGAVVVGLFALFLEESLLLLMIAAFGYLTCWQTRRMMTEFGTVDPTGSGVDFSAQFSFPADEPAARRPGYFERRRLRRQARKLKEEKQHMQEHARAVELILRKISESGISSLTPKERRILEDETRRHRSAGA